MRDKPLMIAAGQAQRSGIADGERCQQTRYSPLSSLLLFSLLALSLPSAIHQLKQLEPLALTWPLLCQNHVSPLGASHCNMTVHCGKSYAHAESHMGHMAGGTTANSSCRLLCHVGAFDASHHSHNLRLVYLCKDIHAKLKFLP